ncbi:MAG TPA: hypothetical protein VFW46_20135 [Stellaceae bacterium]|nr:hypothetical protein [Stellaceae bacterium]
MRPIDIEELLQWAVAQTVEPRLRVPSPRELTLNPYEARPKGVSNRYRGAGVPVDGGRFVADIDAGRVMAAVDRLDPWTRSIVMANAKACRRPDWMEGVEPRMVPVRKRCRRRHRSVVKSHRWEPCSPEAVRATRDIYSRWHQALTRIAQGCENGLLGFQLCGFSAPAFPWVGVERVSP